MIYFLRAGDHVKIGWTRDPQTLDSRRQTLQTGHPLPLMVVRTLDAPRWAEAWFHGFFAGVIAAGEWFAFRPDMLTVVPPAERPLTGIGSRRPQAIPGRRRGRPRTNSVPQHMMLPGELSAAIDAWIEWQKAPKPSRPEAIRRLIARGLKR